MTINIGTDNQKIDKTNIENTNLSNTKLINILNIRNSIDYLNDKWDWIVNEDSICVNNKRHIYWVFDWATWIVKIDIWWKTWWSIASKICSQVFADEDSDLSLIDSAILANQLIKSEMENLWIDTKIKESLFSSTCATIQLKDNNVLEYIKVCDSTILVIDKKWDYKYLWRDINHDTDTINLIAKLQSEWKNPFNEDEVKEQMLKVRIWANTNYWSINWFLNLDFVDNWEVSLDWVSDILIFSDWVYSFEEWDDYTKIVEIYKDSWVQWVKNYIREQENNDPNLIKKPRFKKHDDLAIIWIKLKYD